MARPPSPCPSTETQAFLYSKVAGASELSRVAARDVRGD